MKVKELVEELKQADPDADVYYSTGSSMDDTFGSRHEVEKVWPDLMWVGILTDHPVNKSIVVLEGS